MKTHDLVIAILVVLLLVLLSLPYHFASGYWAESLFAWIAYVLVGVAVGVYTVIAFLQSQRRVVNADEEKKEEEVSS